MNTHMLPVCREIFDDSAEQTAVFSQTLAEYFPDMKKILSCRATATVTSHDIGQNTATLYARIDARMLYLSDASDTLRAASFVIPAEYTFTSDAPLIPADEDARTVIHEKATVISCRAAMKSPRDADITVTTVYDIGVFSCENALLDSCEQDGVCQRIESRTVAATEAITYIGDLRESIVTEDNMPTVGDIIDDFASPILTECAAKDGIITFHAVLRYKCVYLSEGATPSYIYFSKDIPFSGQIENTSLTDGAFIYGDITLNSLSSEKGYDAYGESRIIDVSCSYTVNLTANENGDISYPSDAFAVGTGADVTTKRYPYEALLTTFDENHDSENVILPDASRFSAVNDASVFLIRHHTEHTSEGFIFVGKVFAGVSGTSQNGEPLSYDTVYTLRFPLDVVSPSPKADIDSSAVITTYRVSVKNGQLICDTVTNIRGAIKEKGELSVVTDIIPKEQASADKAEAAYIFYYPRSEEDIWDIAKKYDISPEVIKEENGIISETTEGKKVIRIPNI